MAHKTPLSQNNTFAFLCVSELFRAIDASLVEKLSEICKVHCYQAGEALWHAGEKAQDFLIIKRGMVRLVTDTKSGERSTLTLFGAKETIGLPALLGPKIYPTTAIALSHSVEICRLDAGDVTMVLGKNYEFLKTLNEILVKMYFSLQCKIEVVSSGTVSDRVLALFEYLARRYGDVDEDGNVFIPVHLSRSEIADLVGARIETVIRTMSSWQKRDALLSNRNGFVWNESAALNTDSSIVAI